MFAGDQTRLLDLQQRAKTTGVGEGFQGWCILRNTLAVVDACLDFCSAHQIGRRTSGARSQKRR